MKDPLNPEIADLQSKVENFAQALAEHFDAVQILCSRVNPDGSCQTGMLYTGVGNWYARRGMAADFLETDNARTNAHALSAVMVKSAPEGGDEWGDS